MLVGNSIHVRIGNASVKATPLHYFQKLNLLLTVGSVAISLAREEEYNAKL